MRIAPKLRLLIVGVVLSAVFAGMALRNVNLTQSWETLRQLDPRFLWLPVIIVLADFVLRTWRWQHIFPAPERPGFRRAFAALAISFMGNNLLPGRAGDLARCILVSKRLSASDSTVALATLGLEKLCDGVALLAVVMYSFWLVTPPGWLRHLGMATVIVFGTLLVALLVLRWRAERLINVIRRLGTGFRLPRVGARLAALMAAFAGGLAVLASFRKIAIVVLETAAIWSTEAALFWVFARVLHIELTPSGSIVATAILGLGLMIPAAPAALGTYEFFSISGLRLMGVAAGPALALTLLLHAWVLVFNTGLGLICMTASGLGFSQLARSLDSAKDCCTSGAVAGRTS